MNSNGTKNTSSGTILFLNKRVSWSCLSRIKGAILKMHSSLWMLTFSHLVVWCRKIKLAELEPSSNMSTESNLFLWNIGKLINMWNRNSAVFLTRGKNCCGPKGKVSLFLFQIMKLWVFEVSVIVIHWTIKCILLLWFPLPVPVVYW